VDCVLNEMIAQRKIMQERRAGKMDHKKDGAGCGIMGDRGGPSYHHSMQIADESSGPARVLSRV